MKNSAICFVLTLLFVGLCSCASSSLYYWGHYETEVYAYLNGESIESQISILEGDRQKIEASDKGFPPGFHAHLGLLYAQTGNVRQAVICFEAEKALFPESAAYMDFLLDGYRK